MVTNEGTNGKIDVFNRDAASNLGYLYTTNVRLSSRLATARSMDMILQTGHFEGKSVLDMGCGDGYYTTQLWDRGRPKRLVGLDAAAAAIKVAESRKEDRPLEFVVGDAHRLPFPDDHFDMTVVQSILHHDDDPLDMIREAFRVAPQVLIHEPNGNNLGVRIIEKLSPYHREHAEKSYFASQFKRWIDEAGGRIIRRHYAGFVPMFCSDPLARFMKAIEPLVEAVPLINALGCAVVVILAERK